MDGGLYFPDWVEGRPATVGCSVEEKERGRRDELWRDGSIGWLIVGIGTRVPLWYEHE
jgi:hypothetical protein